jgi:hypothetical protein
MGTALQFLTDENGERTSVLLPWADYVRFMEDMEDLAAMAERRDEKSIPHEEFLAQLKRDGLLRDKVA